MLIPERTGGPERCLCTDLRRPFIGYLAGGQVSVASEIPKRVVHPLAAPGPVYAMPPVASHPSTTYPVPLVLLSKFILLNVKLPVAAGMPPAAAWSAVAPAG